MPSYHFKRAIFSRYPLKNASLSKSNQRGFSFLELLISLLIFAVGFLGLASLQTLSFKMTHDSILHASAVSLSSSLIDQLRVKGKSFDLVPWKVHVAKELPGGTIELLDQGGQYQLKVAWIESEHSGSPSSMQSYALTFRLKE